MSKKQVFLLYNNESDKDLLIANNLASFLSIDPNITLKDLLAGQDQEDLKKSLLESDIVVPVVSIDFLNLKSALQLIEDAQKSNVEVSPILFRQCPWDQFPSLKALADSILPKEKPLNEYDEKSSDGALTTIFNSIKSKLFKGQTPDKVSVDKFYLGLLIAAVLFALATVKYAHDTFHCNDQSAYEYGPTIFYIYLLGNLITIGLPLMKLLAPKMLTSIFKK